jgi:hypothetical protein
MKGKSTLNKLCIYKLAEDHNISLKDAERKWNKLIISKRQACKQLFALMSLHEQARALYDFEMSDD